MTHFWLLHIPFMRCLTKLCLDTCDLQYLHCASAAILMLLSFGSRRNLSVAPMLSLPRRLA